jgi:hypothetical protein
MKLGIALEPRDDFLLVMQGFTTVAQLTHEIHEFPSAFFTPRT